MPQAATQSFTPRTPTVRSRRKPAFRESTSVLADPFRLALLALIVFSLSRLGGYFGLLRLLRPALLLFVFCIGYAFLHKQKLNANNLAHSWTVRLVALIGVVAAGSAVFGISLGHSAVFIRDSFSKTLAITFRSLRSVESVELGSVFSISPSSITYLMVISLATVTSLAKRNHPTTP